MKWTIKFEDGFYIFSRDGVEIYDFPQVKCNTIARFRKWIAHLKQKNWFDENLERDFTDLWKVTNNYNE